jgi:hypothetical protein
LGAIPVFSQTGQSIFNSPTSKQELARVPASAPLRTHIMATFFMGGEYIFFDDDFDWGVGSENGTTVGINVLFIGRTGSQYQQALTLNLSYAQFKCDFRNILTK